VKPISKSKLWKKRLGDSVINPYVGCEHGCFHCYCPVMPGVKFFNHGHSQREWGTYLYPKAGIVEALREQLRNFTPDKANRTDWGDGWVLMSFLTDCYTPAEAKYRITRQCLKLLLEAGHRVRVQTRSVLVERDFDVLAAYKSQVLLGTSLPHLGDTLARCLEPRAAAPSRRLQMLEKAAAHGIPVYAAVAPFLPFHDLTILQRVISAVNPLQPREIFCEVLNPKGDNIAMMSAALTKEFPEHAASLNDYSSKHWAGFTWEVLSCGTQCSERFVPWPDTGRRWRSHLRPEQREFLEAYLPPSSSLPRTRELVAK
jgi:DNA repair photolyase